MLSPPRLLASACEIALAAAFVIFVSTILWRAVQAGPMADEAEYLNALFLVLGAALAFSVAVVMAEAVVR